MERSPDRAKTKSRLIWQLAVERWADGAAKMSDELFNMRIRVIMIRRDLRRNGDSWVGFSNRLRKSEFLDRLRHELWVLRHKELILLTFYASRHLTGCPDRAR